VRVLEPAGLEGVRLTMGGDRERQLHEGFGTRFYEPHGQEGALAIAGNVHFGKAQPSWDLQQHVRQVLVSGPSEKLQLPAESPPRDPFNPWLHHIICKRTR